LILEHKSALYTILQNATAILHCRFLRVRNHRRINPKEGAMKRINGILMDSGTTALAAVLVAVALGFGAANAFADEPIVGLWEATWTDDSGGPGQGQVFLTAWDVWHADGTEAQNDSGPVIAGFVCQGAWKSLGKRTYFLSHPSYSYTGPDGRLDTTNSAVIYEKVTVSNDGKSFEGKGLVKAYTGIDPFDPSATVFYELPLKIKAKRVVADPSQLP
jgi:hypothetical protein